MISKLYLSYIKKNVNISKNKEWFVLNAKKLRKKMICD